MIVRQSRGSPPHLPSQPKAPAPLPQTSGYLSEESRRRKSDARPSTQSLVFAQLSFEMSSLSAHDVILPCIGP
ncbi:hypothetical protein IG631_07026 [Alternaria alternata]|nr:hypothetical protein IG631_07026 [Alternaria alternata]